MTRTLWSPSRSRDFIPVKTQSRTTASMVVLRHQAASVVRTPEEGSTSDSHAFGTRA